MVLRNDRRRRRGRRVLKRKRSKFRLIPLLILAIAVIIFLNYRENPIYKAKNSSRDTPDSSTQQSPAQQEDIDRITPEITLFPMKEEVLTTINDFVEPGYIAIDNYDGDLTSSVQTSIERIRPNYYQVSYMVEDSSCNTGFACRILHVVSGEIALTFDDGPSSNITPAVLDTLEANNINATFFVLAFDNECASIIKRAYDDGNTIGYHGYSHKYSDIYTSIDVLMENFYRIEQDVLEVTGGESSRLIRFPGGSSNTVSKNYCQGIMSEATQRVMSEGYVYYDWNIDSDDAGSAKTSEEILYNVTTALRPGRLNVVLMHDAFTKAETLGALQDIINYGVENDYEFVTLTTDSKQVKHGVSN